MMLSKSTLFLSIVIVACGIALAQTTQSNPDVQSDPASKAAEGSQRAESLQGFLASCIALGNNGEVVLGQLAKDRAKNDRVKEFAETMIKDHQKVIAKLQNFLPPTVAQLIRSESQEGKNREMAENRPEGSTRMSMRPIEGGSQLLQIEVQAARNCGDLMKKELSTMQGAEFDRAYVGQQIGAHIHMLAKLRAVEPYVNGDLKQVVQQGIEMTQKHLDEAKSICKDLQGQSRE
jgi:predicted outer membrane protein